jgi:hypothetical protein
VTHGQADQAIDLKKNWRPDPRLSETPSRKLQPFDDIQKP